LGAFASLVISLKDIFLASKTGLFQTAIAGLVIWFDC